MKLTIRGCIEIDGAQGGLSIPTTKKLYKKTAPVANALGAVIFILNDQL